MKAMPNKQKQMLAVWGSPGSGKTVTAVKLATELSKQKKNVVVVLCDTTAPPLPALIRTKNTPDCSVGAVLAAPIITQELVMKNLAAYDKNPYISLLGYKAGENIYTYAEYSKERAVDMLVLLRHIADYVIVDTSSSLTDNILSTTALEVADDVLRICSCDLKGISYFMSYLPLVGDRRFKADKHIKVLSNPHSYEGGREYENSYGGVKYRLPYIPSIEEQAATLNLTESLSGKEAKAYEPVISAIAREVFADGK
jgi:cellulose biosynthesis protein BcsQ